MLVGAGNRGRNPRAFPVSDTHVIGVGACSNKFTPWQGSGEGSNYGRDIVNLWAPGLRVPLTGKSGQSGPRTGTSVAAPYVSGMLAIFYGVEGPNMNPTLALERLMAQTDDWMTLPDGTDWEGSPLAVANTGNRKGDAETPKRVYRGGPEVESSTSVGECSAEVAIAINRAGKDKPLVAVSMFNEKLERVGEVWNGEMTIGETKSTGGLGPELVWKMKTGVDGFPFGLDFTYDVESWDWHGCEFMSTTELGRGESMESRRCAFPCHG